MRLIACCFAIALACLVGCGEEERAYSARALPAGARAEPPRGEIEEPAPVPEARVETTLAEIAEARAQRPDDARMAAHVEEWSQTMARLTAAQQHDEADRIADAVVDLRPSSRSERFDSFTRDRFRVRGIRVDAARYFEPVPLYAEDSRITKSLRFSVHHKDRVVRRYYLEHDTQRALFMLGRTDDDGHRMLVAYGAEAPPYHSVRAGVIADLAATLSRE